MVSCIMFIFGLIVGYCIKFIPKFDKNRYKNCRRGIVQMNHHASYKTSSGIEDVDTESIAEVIELEASGGKSKIKIIDVRFDKSVINSPDWVERYMKMYNNSWIDTSLIKYIEKDKSEERREKIDKII